MGGRGRVVYVHIKSHNHFLIIVMTIGHPHHFVISHGCHIDEIKVMKSFRIMSPNLLNLSTSLERQLCNLLPLITALGKSSKWTSSGPVDRLPWVLLSTGSASERHIGSLNCFHIPVALSPVFLQWEKPNSATLDHYELKRKNIHMFQSQHHKSKES